MGFFADQRPRLIETIHSKDYGHPLFERVSPRLNPGLDQVVAVSDAVARGRLARFAHRLEVVRPGVNVSAISRWSREQATTLRREAGVADRRTVLAMVAGFRSAKNHRRLVEAVEIVAQSDLDADEFVVLLAGDGPTRESVQRAISDRQLQPYFRYLGSVAHGWQVVASADALVLTSDREGLPVVVMEAMAAGVPVLSTDVGGVHELVSHGGNGLLFDQNPESAADAIGAFVTDPELRRGLRNLASTQRPDVDIGRTANQMELIYARLVARG